MRAILGLLVVLEFPVPAVVEAVVEVLIVHAAPVEGLSLIHLNYISQPLTVTHNQSTHTITNL